MTTKTFQTDVTFTCPFCGKTFSVDQRERAIVHELPMCDKFEQLEPDEFLAAVNDAVTAKRGVGLA